MPAIMARPAQRGVNGGSGRYTQFAWTLKRPLRHRRVVVNELFGRDHGIRRKRIMVPRDGDRKSVVEGKGVSVRVDLGGCRIIKKKNITTNLVHVYIT